MFEPREGDFPGDNVRICAELLPRSYGSMGIAARSARSLLRAPQGARGAERQRPAYARQDSACPSSNYLISLHVRHKNGRSRDQPVRSRCTRTELPGLGARRRETRRCEESGLGRYFVAAMPLAVGELVLQATVRALSHPFLRGASGPRMLALPCAKCRKIRLCPACFSSGQGGAQCVSV